MKSDVGSSATRHIVVTVARTPAARKARLNSDYPVFTVALRVPVAASIGSIFPVSIGGAGRRFMSPTGTVYPTEMKDGSVTVADAISIDDVNPGSADLQAGSVVSIVGRGFRPTTRMKFDTAKLSAVRYVGPTHIQVVLASATRMHGQRILPLRPQRRVLLTSHELHLLGARRGLGAPWPRAICASGESGVALDAGTCARGYSRAAADFSNPMT
jgi:hypothetical protein